MFVLDAPLSSPDKQCLQPCSLNQVRDTVYLYAWSLLKRQQEEADLVQEEDSR